MLSREKGSFVNSSEGEPSTLTLALAQNLHIPGTTPYALDASLGLTRLGQLPTRDHNAEWQTQRREGPGVSSPAVRAETW